MEDPDSGGTLLEAWSGDMQMLGSGSDYAGEGQREEGYSMARENMYLWRLGRGQGREREGIACLVGISLEICLFWDDYDKGDSSSHRE